MTTKMIELRIPVAKRIEFSFFITAMEIGTALSFSTGDFLGDTYINVICKIEDTDIGAALKEEKLREKYGRYIL